MKTSPRLLLLAPFHDVEVKCLDCGGKSGGRMQVESGVYLWDCDLCRAKTKHKVRRIKR